MTFFVTLLFFLFIMLAMAVGVIFGRPPFKGSCGGLGAVGINQDCELCRGDRGICSYNGGVPSEMRPKLERRRGERK